MSTAKTYLDVVTSRDGPRLCVVREEKLGVFISASVSMLNTTDVMGSEQALADLLAARITEAARTVAAIAADGVPP